MITIQQTTQNHLTILSHWDGSICTLKLHNATTQTLPLGEVVLVAQKNPFPRDTWYYGEGYSKLAQYQGTVDNFKMSGSLGDQEHYKFPKPDGCCQVYNMLLASSDDQNSCLVGFNSCNHFTGIFRFTEEHLQIVLDGENKKILPGETIELEQLFVNCGNRNDLLKQFAAAIRQNHPRLASDIPTGWCSWTVYGPDVTEQNIFDSLNAIQERNLSLKYIQIDDGYQLHMGDWLHTTDKFERGLDYICQSIKDKGFEPAIWVAPFIAEKDSLLFQEHPDWFIKDEDGLPMPSNRHTFGGWRCGPWYMLDGTHPGAQEYLTHVFRTMRAKWNITYFKLDANMWGAMPFGHRYDDNKTCVEAYRMGMKAILEGAGEDSFLLGCNAPMWPSLGTVHGMRVTNDNSRDYRVFRSLARQCFPRNWQNCNLWINDPDTMILQNKRITVMDPAGKPVLSETTVTEEEFLFNAAYTLASGGMVLSGDDITELTAQNTCYLKKILTPTGIAADFDDLSYEVGRIHVSSEKLILVLFNYSDETRNYIVPIDGSAEVADFWSEKTIGFFDNQITVENIPPHAARIFVCSFQN